MKKMLKIGLLSPLTVIMLAACSTEAPGDGGSEGEQGNSGDGERSIGLSVSTLNNPFFVSLREGVETAAEENNINLSTVDAQDAAATQASDIEDLIQEDVDLLLINPVDSEAIGSAIEQANNADIPVVTLDREAEDGEVAAHITSNNIQGGEMAAEHLVETLGEDASVAELQGIPGASATNERGEGFHNVADDALNVSASQTANFNRSEGLSVMENVLQTNSDIEGVFAHNDEMALGALEALEGAGMEEEVYVVGFDGTEDALQAIEEGELDATVAQQPEKIGEESVSVATSILEGEEVEENTSVELELITE